jgi:hypothetical protein
MNSRSLTQRVADLEEEHELALLKISRLREAIEKALTANHLDFARTTLQRALTTEE